MNRIIYPGRLSGTVEIPSSKSYAHRLLIAAALGTEPVFVGVNALNEDILATVRCLSALGAGMELRSDGYFVTPIRTIRERAVLDCGESGSTLRFLLPVAAALGAQATFTGRGRLPQRPNDLLIDALAEHGVRATASSLPMTFSGTLRGGEYRIAGNVSSQYITGLMLALPLCDIDSRIVLTTKTESAAYIDITLECLRRFGIRIDRTDSGWFIPGCQRYRADKRVDSEGDWSSASFWLAANSIGSAVTVKGLNPDSVQGDRHMGSLIKRLGQVIDVSDTPDLVPPLAVAAALHMGTTVLTGAARLRLKESDRLRSVHDLLRAFGADVEIQSDALIVRGGKALTGGLVNGCNDHRIVMSAAIAATCATGPVVITDAEAVAKSYPEFFTAFAALGGRMGEAHV